MTGRRIPKAIGIDVLEASSTRTVESHFAGETFARFERGERNGTSLQPARRGIAHQDPGQYRHGAGHPEDDPPHRPVGGSRRSLGGYWRSVHGGNRSLRTGYGGGELDEIRRWERTARYRNSQDRQHRGKKRKRQDGGEGCSPDQVPYRRGLFTQQADYYQCRCQDRRAPQGSAGRNRNRFIPSGHFSRPCSPTNSAIRSNSALLN